MQSAQTQSPPGASAAPPATRPATAPRQKPRPRHLPPHAVVLFNDNINGADYVIGVLRKVFNYGRMKSFVLMMRAHLTGRAIVWTGSLELAELKAEQLQSCGPDPRMKARGAQKLRVGVEPLPR